MPAARRSSWSNPCPRGVPVGREVLGDVLASCAAAGGRVGGHDGRRRRRASPERRRRADASASRGRPRRDAAARRPRAPRRRRGESAVALTQPDGQRLERGVARLVALDQARRGCRRSAYHGQSPRPIAREGLVHAPRTGRGKSRTRSSGRPRPFSDSVAASSRGRPCAGSLRVGLVVLARRRGRRRSSRAVVAPARRPLGHAGVRVDRPCRRRGCR